MASVFQVTARWENFIGAPGYTKFHFLDVVGSAGAGSVTAAARTFLNAFAGTVPIGVTIQVAAEVPEYDEVTGTLLGEVVAGTLPALITGTAAGSYAGGAGAFVAWKTGTIWQGRRVQGRTFMVPQAGIFETNGTLSSAFITSATAAATSLINDPASTFAIWAKRFTVVNGALTQTNGAAFQVTSALVRDQASGLRSRRT